MSSPPDILNIRKRSENCTNCSFCYLVGKRGNLQPYCALERMPILNVEIGCSKWKLGMVKTQLRGKSDEQKSAP